MKAVLAGLAVVSVAVVGFILMSDDGADSGTAAVLSHREATEDTGFDLTAAQERAAPASAAPLTAASGADDIPAPQLTGAATLEVAAVVEPTPVSGRVVDTFGNPVPDATVTFLPGGPEVFRLRFRASSPDDEAPDWPTATTDARGRFRFEAELPEAEEDDGGPAFFRPSPQLIVTHENYATLVEAQRGLDADVGAAADVGDLVVESGAWITGRVVDGAGRPVSGAEVRARNDLDPSERRPFSFLGGMLGENFNRMTTGADGRFAISGLMPGMGSVTARHEGMQSAHSPSVELVVGGSGDVGDLVMEVGETIAGYVMDEDGRPLEGATIRVSSMARILVNRMEDMPRRSIGEEFSLRAETDETGWFELSGLLGGTYNVHASADGHARETKENVPSGTLDLGLYLPRLGSVLLTVKSARGGVPVDGAEIGSRSMRSGRWGRSGGGGDDTAVLTGAEALAAAEINADPEGVYLIQNAGVDGTLITIHADGFAVTEVEAPGVVSDELVRVEAELLPETIVRGRVVNEEDEPVAGASVRVREAPEPEGDIVFDAGGGRRQIRRDVERVIGGRGDGSDAHSTRTDDQGVYEVRGLPAGEWEVLVRAETLVPPEPVPLVLDEGEIREDIDFKLAMGGSIAGVVTEADGTLVPEMDVIISALDNAPSEQDELSRQLGFVIGLGAGEGDRRVTTDDEGRFEEDGLAPGRYEVKLAPPRSMRMGRGMFFAMRGTGDDDKAESVTVDVVAGEESVANIVRARRGSIRGRVLAAGEPAAEVTVTMKESGSFRPFGGETAETDAYGNFAFDDVSAGDYTLSALPPGAAMEETVDVGIGPGESRIADIVFAGATLRGRVVDADTGMGVEGVSLTVSKVEVDESSSPFAGAGGNIQVVMVAETTDGGASSGMEMRFGGGPVSKVRSDQSGRFELKYLKPGTYEVKASGGGYVSGEAGPIEVEEGQLLDDITITVPKGAVIRGIVRSGETGDVLAQLPVRCESADGGMQMMEMTEADGSYLFEGLEAGTYAVKVLGSGFGDEPIAESSVQVETGEQRTANLVTSTDDD